MKVALNECFGGFNLSEEAEEFINSRREEADNYTGEWRTNPVLIECIETLGSERASGMCSEINIEEYDDNNYEISISEYDGYEELELIPKIKRSMLESCKSVDEIINYLQDLCVRAVFDD